MIDFFIRILSLIETFIDRVLDLENCLPAKGNDTITWLEI